MTASKNPSFQTAITEVIQTQESLEFRPTTAQRKLKAKFWATQRDNPSVDPELVTASLVAEVCNTTRAQEWWSQPGFKDWFTNTNEARQKAEYVFHLLLDAIEGLALSDNPKAFSSQIAAFKALGDYLGHTAKKQAPPLALPSDPVELAALVETLSKRLSIGENA